MNAVIISVMCIIGAGFVVGALVMFYYAWSSYREGQSWSPDLTTAVILTLCGCVAGGTAYVLYFLETMRSM